MKVRIIRDCTGPNPEHDPRQKPGPGNWPHRPIPIGTEIEDPDAWHLCLPQGGQPAVAEPLDTEAHDKVTAFQAKQRKPRGEATAIKFPGAPTDPTPKPAKGTK